MNKVTRRILCPLILPVAFALGVPGCQSDHNSATAASAPAATAETAAASPGTSDLPAVQKAIRIKAGATAPFKDSQGNVWAANEGFSGGDAIERPDQTIANTAEPDIYQSEHYGMESFSWPLANGKYLVKLHFCETYDGINGPGQRVFSFNVQGRDFEGFDVWVKAGGPLKADVESVPVEVTNGKLLITFTRNVENPQINGIEIIPQS